MARRRKMTPERREFINGLLEHYQPTDAQDVQEMLKDLLGDVTNCATRLRVNVKDAVKLIDQECKDKDLTLDEVHMKKSIFIFRCCLLHMV